MSELDVMLKPKKVWQKWWIWMILFLLLSLAAIVYRYIVNAQSVSFQYITQPLAQGDLNMTVSATGYLYPLRSVDVGSEVSGTLMEVNVDFNDKVHKGDVLARIDQTKYLSSLKRAEATLHSMRAVLKSVEADMQLKENNYKRNQSLKKNSGGKLPIQKDWDQNYAAYLSSKASYESSKAQVQEAQFAFESTQYDLDKTIIYAPMDGVVLSRNIDLGQTVTAMFQTPVLFKLSDNLLQMELQVSIDEADVAQIKEGQPALFSVDAYPDENFHAVVKSIRINSEMLAGVVTYKASLYVENQSHKLLPGMSADADVIIKHIKNAWIVPRAALLYIPVEVKEKIKFGAQNTEKLTLDTQPHVWVERGGKAVKIYVKILGTSGTQTAVASEDLKPEDKLILSQEQRL